MRDRHNVYRLTVDDETRAVERMRGVVEDWRRVGVVTDRTVLVRVGAHAIGCTIDDLRDPEVLWLQAKASEMLEDVYR